MWADSYNTQRLLYCILLCFHLTAKCCLADDERVEQSQRNLSRRSKGIAGAATNHAASGCFHNNSLFADTSIVPTTEPCLLCKCSTKNLICVRRVCKDQPYPPPRGCILVHKKNVCCPYLSCSTKHLHINYYKNTERNRDHHQANRVEQHEKTLEKHARTDDDDDDGGSEDGEFHGGCIESGSLYASGSAMVRSSSSMCSYCYCIGGKQKCIKPKCVLENTKCKPIFIDASCCPVKYDCSSNSTNTHASKSTQHETNSLAQRKNRSNGCHENGKYYQEGEQLPSDQKRPCELCYCIKGFRKCVVKKCAPSIKGCLPKLPENGNCCPTSYDCSATRRSLKIRRQVRQHNNEEEDNDSIDFFSLLFGSDEPQEETKTESTVKYTEITTPIPFKVLPTTEQSFFDFIRAGFEIIDKNADAISSVLTSANQSTTDIPLVSTPNPVTTTVEAATRPTPIVNNQVPVKAENVKIIALQSTTTAKTSTLATTAKPKASHNVSSSTTTRAPATTVKINAKNTSTTRVNKVKSSSATTPKPKASTTTRKQINASEKSNSSNNTTPATATTPKSQDLKTRVSPKVSTTKATTKFRPAMAVTTTTRKRVEQTTTTKLPPTTLMQKSNAAASEAQVTKRMPVATTTTTAPQVVYKDVSPLQIPPHIPLRKVIPTFPTTSTSNHAIRNPYDDFFNIIAHPLPAQKVINEGEHEAEALPDIEIIPFVAHDAIDHDKFETYLQHRSPYEDNLEKDYFASSHNTEKPYRYNNKFIQHSTMYNDAVEHGVGFANPHERIDNGPFYYENNENQFEAFSPPREQDFIGGFAPAKESMFNEQSKLAATEINNMQKSPPVEAQTHKSNMTSEKLSLAINQTSTTIHRGTVDDVIPSFKKISNNFTSYLDNFLHHETSTAVPISSSTTQKTTTTAPAAQTTKKSHATTSQPLKPLIDDDDFIRKHFKSPSSWEHQQQQQQQQHQQQNNRDNGPMEIFSKPTTPTMNGLLKLAGCNIYGRMYNVGQYIVELSNACLDCKCLPDVGVSCTTKC